MTHTDERLAHCSRLYTTAGEWRPVATRFIAKMAASHQAVASIRMRRAPTRAEATSGMTSRHDVNCSARTDSPAIGIARPFVMAMSGSSMTSHIA